VMNYGLHLSASGVLTNMYRQDVFANNLANVGTVGFKRDLASIRQREPEAMERSYPQQYRNRLLEQIGGGVFAAPGRTDFKTGALEVTHRKLDVALTKDDVFFAVAYQDENSESEVRLTRDGRFMVDPQGYLTNVNGHRVLDAADQPIQLDPGQGEAVSITTAGRVLQGDEVRGRIQIATVDDKSQLVKKGANLFGFKTFDPRVEGARTGELRSGALESSGVDPIRELLNLIEASGAVESNANMIRYHDLMMDNAVNRLGRIA